MQFDSQTPPTVEELITCDTEIMSGTPVFKNTRVPIKNLIDYLEVGESLDAFWRTFRLSAVSKRSKRWNSRIGMNWNHFSL